MNNKGFSLIESLVVILIVGISCLAIFNFQKLLTLEGGNNSLQQQALHYAQTQLDSYKSFTGNSNTSGVDYDEIAAGTTTETINTSRATFTRTTVISSNISPDYKTIRVTVTWVDPRGKTQTVSVQDAISRIAPSDSAAILGSTA